MKNDFAQATENLQANSERIAGEIGDAVTDAKQLLKSYGAEKLDVARDSFAHAQSALTDGAKQYAATANGYVRDNPWQVIGMAAAAGVLLGVLFARR